MKIVAIDESGDPGNKINKGSSEYFSVALSVFENTKDIDILNKKLEELAVKLFKNKDHEFHFSHEKFKYRKEFFEVISELDFRVLVMLVHKEKHQNIKDFYSFIFEYIFKNFKKETEESFLKIDGGNKKNSNKNNILKINTIAKKFDYKIGKIKFYDSKKNRDIQVSDFFAGAVRRYFEDKDPNDVCLYQIYKKKVKVVVL